MVTCQGKLSNGEPCPKILKSGQTYCRWHNREDESWREIYERLEMATREEKTDIVLRLIEEHPEHKLVLPNHNGQKANLTKINLGWETIDKKRKKSRLQNPPWWYLRGWIGSTGANLHLANLQHADLRLADLKGANLMFANLQGADLRLANLQDADLRLADLKGANLTKANLQHAQLGETNLQGADLGLADLQGADLRNANLQDVNFREAKLQGVDLSNVRNMTNVDLSGAWLDRTRMRRERLGDRIPEERDGDYAAAKRGYISLRKNFDDLGDYDAASWAYRKERQMEKLEAGQAGRSALAKRKWREASASYFKFFSDTLVEWLCDYGQSVWRVAGWMAALLFIITPLLLSGMGGIVWSEDLYRHYSALPSAWHRFWFWYYHYFLYAFSVLTTANFSDLQPINDAVKLASGLFAIAGIVLAGLLGFIAGHRIRRS